MGAGTLSFPYAISKNGLAFGTFLVILGAMVSYYSGMLIVIASNYSEKNKYEEMAYVIYGKKFARLASICNLICLLGFVMSFIVFVSTNYIIIIVKRINTTDYTDIY